MTYSWCFRLTWGLPLLLMMCLPLTAGAQQPAASDADLARQGALALAAAHGEKPRYGGKFLSVGNEEVPFYDMHQTSLGGVYAAIAPAYNCLIRTSPYDPKGQEIIPELADSWEVSADGKQVTFHLHKRVKWHDGAPFSAADVKYIELEPMLFAQLRANEVSGNYSLSSLGAAMDFDDPIDSFGQLYVTRGGRWYQRRSLPELDKLYEQQKFIADSEARK